MLNKLIAIMSERAADAHFHPVSIEAFMLNDDQKWEDGRITGQLGYWESDFASMLLVDFTKVARGDVEQLSKRAENYLDARILQREKSRPVIDGYLVMAVSSDDEFKDFILTIERNTLFVRKHVVIETEKGWERCERITPLGLARTEAMIITPPFSPDDSSAEDLLEAIANMGSQELAAIHGKEWNLNE